MKVTIAAAACAVILGMVAPAKAAPLDSARGMSSTAQSTVVDVHSKRGHWHKHHNRGHHYGWGKRRCWTSCTGIGPLRVCKRKCRTHH
ncbi:MAG: hypothetical protein JNM89_15065 [Hyphomicrobiaceae bacterium]|nr:hypothetical protein [Hyphomicrobiaceae bacterium]